MLLELEQLQAIASHFRSAKLSETQVSHAAAQQRLLEFGAQLNAVSRKNDALYQEVNQDEIQKSEEETLVQELEEACHQRKRFEQEIFDCHNLEVGKLWRRLESEGTPNASPSRPREVDPASARFFDVSCIASPSKKREVDPASARFVDISCKNSKCKMQILEEEAELEQLKISEEACAVEMAAQKVKLEQYRKDGDEELKEKFPVLFEESGAAEFKELQEQQAQAAHELREFQAQWRQAQDELAVLRIEGLEDSIAKIEAEIPVPVAKDMGEEKKTLGKTSGKQSQKSYGREEKVLRLRNKPSDGADDCKQQ